MFNSSHSSSAFLVALTAEARSRGGRGFKTFNNFEKLLDMDFGRLLPVLLLVGLTVLFVGYVVIRVKLYRRHEVRRLAALARVATELGMGFTTEERTILTQLAGINFALFVDPTTRATSVMRGTIGSSPLALFDYHVTYSVGNNKESMELTVAAFDLASQRLPVFDAEAQGWGTRLINKALPGKNVVDFSDDPDFARHFNVTGNDGPSVRLLFDRYVRSFLRQHRNEWTFRSNGRWFVMYRDNKRLKPDEYRKFLEEATDAMRVITKRI